MSTRWLTSRKLITAVGVTIATVALFKGKMTDSVWVYAMAVFIAGHHAADLIKAFHSDGGDIGGGEARDWKGGDDARSVKSDNR